MSAMTLTYDPATDRPQEECGVFGVRGADEASVLVAFGLHALQHRGQEACGITSYNGAASTLSAIWAWWASTSPILIG
jgi:amidophosphoribosyltransferase